MCGSVDALFLCLHRRKDEGVMRGTSPTVRDGGLIPRKCRVAIKSISNRPQRFGNFLRFNL